MHVRRLAAVAATALSMTASTVLSVAVVGAPAQAAGSRTVSGPATGDADVFLTYVRCDDLFGAAAAPQSRINLGPYSAPLGRRSLGLVPRGAGSATGPYTAFDSLTGIDASVSVAATSGGSGVSWVMATTPSSPRGTAWSGRAPVDVAPGGWRTVSAAATTYSWSLVDIRSGARLADAGTATPAGFAAEHGDGAGFTVTGFGCDGTPFNLDAVRGAGTTVDFEGGALSTSIAAGRAQVPAGDEVELTGRVADGAGRLTGDPLVLESRTAGGGWTQVGVQVVPDRDGVTRVRVRVEETTDYRWHRPEGQYADEGWSDPVTVTVPRAQQSPDDPGTGSPSGSPTEAPAQG